MTDRLALALVELVDALRAEVREELQASAPPREAPVELVSVEEFARRIGIGRSSAYVGVGSGSVRSVKVGGRRLIPASEVARLAKAAR
jgi:excisionase family DNA binding protein